MKKFLMAFGAASLLAAGFASADGETSGSVGFRGAVYASTCVIDGEAHQTVDLGRVKANDLAGGRKRDAVGGEAEFTLRLKDCPVIAEASGNERPTSVKVYLNPHADNVLPGSILKNTATGDTAATNVGVQIRHKGQIVTLSAPDAGKQSQIAWQPFTSLTQTQGQFNTAAFPFTAQIVSTFGSNLTNINPGQVTASTPFTIEYK